VYCSDDEWEQAQYELPTPHLTDPNRWWPTPIHTWIRERGIMLRSDPQVLFVRDIPQLTGLAADSVRRYRWMGLLPAPDGAHRGRPWWHHDTITEWDRTRNRDHTPTRHRP